MKGLDVTHDFIATGGADGVVQVLTSDGNRIESSAAHTDIINSVAIGPHGRVASGSRDRTIRLFDPTVPRSYVIGEHDHWVMSVAWSDDGARLVTGSEDGTIGLWNPEDASVTRLDLGYPVNGVDWQGDVIAAARGDRTLDLFTGQGVLIRSIPGADQLLWATSLSPNGTHVAWTGRDRYLRIAPVHDGDPIVVPAHTDQIWSVTWNETGTQLATASADGTVGIWASDGRPLERISVPTWARRATFRGLELYVATEPGHLHIFSTDGLDGPTPAPVAIERPPASCAHWDPQIEDAGWRPRCAECGSYEEPRLCVTCGHIGCCESQLAHGTKHWIATGHPNTVPASEGPYAWRWCYADDMYVKRIG
jgi:hypothetical protein